MKLTTRITIYFGTNSSGVHAPCCALDVQKITTGLVLARDHQSNLYWRPVCCRHGNCKTHTEELPLLGEKIYFSFDDVDGKYKFCDAEFAEGCELQDISEGRSGFLDVDVM